MVAEPFPNKFDHPTLMGKPFEKFGYYKISILPKL